MLNTIQIDPEINSNEYYGKMSHSNYFILFFPFSHQLENFFLKKNQLDK